MAAVGGGRGAVDAGRDGGVAPPCACHGEPSYWAKYPRSTGGHWRCRVRKREVGAAYQRRRRAARIAAGLCASCGKDVAVTTLCFDCLTRKDEWNSTRAMS